MHVLGAYIAETTGQHDGLVIAAHFAIDDLLEYAEITADVGPPELIVEGRGTQRTVEHNRERTGDALRLAVIGLPRLLAARDAQIGNGKPADAGLGFGTTAGGTLVADLTAAAGGGAGKR